MRPVSTEMADNVDDHTRCLGGKSRHTITQRDIENYQFKHEAFHSGFKEEVSLEQGFEDEA